VVLVWIDMVVRSEPTIKLRALYKVSPEQYRDKVVSRYAGFCKGGLRSAATRCRLEVSSQSEEDPQSGGGEYKFFKSVPWFQECAELAPEWLLREGKGKGEVKVEARRRPCTSAHASGV
jgi:hypothetical protein